MIKILKILGLKEINIRLTKTQINQINNWYNDWKRTEKEELIKEIEIKGFHIQDIIEWMDEITRKRIFKSANYYKILDIEDKLKEEFKKAFKNKQIFVLQKNNK